MRQARVGWCMAALSIAVAACGSPGSASPGGSTETRDGGAHGESPDDAGGATDPGLGGGPSGGDDAANGTDATAIDGGDAAVVVNPHPTVSSWLGTTIAADLPRVDITYQLNPFDTAAAQLDANGYPVAAASGTSSTDIGYVLPSGTYKISSQGAGSPGAFGTPFTLAIPSGSSQTVQGIHIYSPGFDYDSTTTFLPQFVSIL